MVNLHIPFTFLLLGRVPCSEHTETVFFWGESPRNLLLCMFECENKANHVLTQVHTIFLPTCVIRIIIRTHRSERVFTHDVGGRAVSCCNTKHSINKSARHDPGTLPECLCMFICIKWNIVNSNSGVLF